MGMFLFLILFFFLIEHSLVGYVCVFAYIHSYVLCFLNHLQCPLSHNPNEKCSTSKVIFGY